MDKLNQSSYRSKEEVSIEDFKVNQELLTTINNLFLGEIRMSKTNEEFKQQGVGDLPKVKLMAPSLDGGPDREVTVVYQRKANYGTPSFLKDK
ncbi:hypothetical protein EC604_23245 [Paenibacillus amylolyticus]|uniref:Uncharacterized protein n=1 Tax=Paenibacillus amylolyticus TaxID=1451 RepID=A0A5M9WYH3_PAEAM|nr:hypothetical protein [Paenibacillus amylolyticus]KAA8786747.1 hypothetical protein EC604_23245 [Paenibacillus amylolyticus]